MGEVINLRQARKLRERREREDKADANRAAFGRAKAERQLSEAQARLEGERFDAHRLETGGTSDGDDVA